MRRALLDTSVVIAPPDPGTIELRESSISVITVAELHKGVLVSPEEVRPQRLARLAEAEVMFTSLPVDLDSARAFGRYMAEAKRAGRPMRIRDGLIAATAEANGLTVFTRDRDFERFGVECVVVDG